MVYYLNEYYLNNKFSKYIILNIHFLEYNLWNKVLIVHEVRHYTSKLLIWPKPVQSSSILYDSEYNWI